METDNTESYERRREQVRRAQKTHRERKFTYVKSLEDEVAELRKQNAALIKESAASQDLVRELQETLISKGIPLPANCTTKSRPADDQISVGMAGSVFPNQRLEACYPSCESSSTVAQSANIDLPHVVVNFVLSLEQPCIYHHRVPSPELLLAGSLGGTGHRSMLSSPIMARAPPFSLNPFKMGYPPDAEWHTPTIELESLLQMSQQLELGEEVTPIQVWHGVRQHSKFCLLTPEHLELFRARLFPLVKCYGFGAAIHRSDFEEIVEALFNSV